MKNINLPDNVKFILVFCISVLLFAFSEFNESNYAHPKFELGFLILILIIGIILIQFYSKNKDDIVKITFITILIFGVLCAFTTPIMDTPDELYHFYRSELTSEGILFSSSTNDYMDTIGTVDEFNRSVKLEVHGQPVGFTVFESNADTSTINVSKTDFYMPFLHNSFIGYLPQAIGILIAKLFDLNAVWLVWLGRLCNLLFYDILVSYAIKKTPIFKIPIALVAAMPMSIYLAASLSIDAAVNGLGILAIAFALYMYKSEKSLEIKDILLFDIIVFLCGTCKITYILLIFLVLLIPMSKFKNKKMYLLTIFSSITGVLLIFYLYTCYVSHTINLPTLEMFFNQSTNTGNSSITTDNSDSLTSRFSIKNLKFLIKSEIFGFYEQCERLFTFGWLTYASPILSTFSFIYYGLIGFFYPENSEINLKYKIFSFLMILLIYSATFFALIGYSLSHRPDAILIEGVQGRYFIPMLSLMPLAFNINKNKRFKNMDLWIFTALLIILSSFVMLTIVFYY